MVAGEGHRKVHPTSHRSWRRAFFVDRSSWKLPSLNAVEVPASVFRLQPIRAAVLLLGMPLPRDPCCCLGIRAHCHLGIRAPLPPSIFVVVVMAELLGSPKNAGLDAGSTSKAENVSIQVTSIRLTKDNYLSWSAALEIGITSRARLSYITGDKPAPLKSDPQWETWALEDSQVRKKRHLRTYQIKRSIYSLTQGDLSVAAYYAALKTKWEELDYHVTDEWKCGSDHSLHWEKEWMDRTFLFLGDFCWDLHPENRLVRGRPPSGRRSPSLSDSSQGTPSSGVKTTKLSPDQLKELQAYIGRLSTTPEESSTSDGAQLTQALVASSDQGNSTLGDWIVDSGWKASEEN
ncbi:hypothetical protein EJ110_NYTH05757 [Nymphaea thermarum]|nr:hypothetical protein EJ110_NYTH05757 [Nymphaea thermarum]